MGEFVVTQTGIEGLAIIEPKVYGDSRGYFLETFNRRDMEALGLDFDFVQDNQSLSVKGVLRGLHYQKEYPQTKIVRVLTGEVFDVAVDIRRGSPTYGKWFGVLLSAENKKQFLIAKGFAHGFLVLSDEAEFAYKVDDYWHPEDEYGIRWDDPDLNIKWPEVDIVKKEMLDGTKLILSEKDLKWDSFDLIEAN